MCVFAVVGEMGILLYQRVRKDRLNFVAYWSMDIDGIL